MLDKLPINIEDLLHQRSVEGERIEYKAGWNPDAIMRSVCAFANDFANLGGGYVVIGQDCDEHGLPVFPPVGVAESLHDRIQRELLAYCKLIQPPYFPRLSLAEFAGRKLIVIWAPGGETRPYKVPAAVTAKQKSWHYYIRRYTSTIEAVGDDERELFSLTAKVPFDDRFCQGARLDDLSHALMTEFLHEVGSDLADLAELAMPLESVGRQMNVVGGAQEAPLPKNVGLMFFNEAPERFFPGTQIDVLWFPEGAGGDRFEEKTFKGPLGRMVRETLGYIQRNFLHETVVKQPQRAEAERFWNFPYAAVEEAVVNAVYHRSYEEREPIEVRISPDELVVLSFPGPDRSIALADLQAGRAVSRRYRNRRLGEFLKELDLTEGRATGIPKILRVMAANGSPRPILETDDARVSFVIRLPVHDRSRAVSGSTTEATTEATTEVTTEVAALLSVVHDEMPRQALQAALGLKNAEHFRKAYLVPAIAAGLLEMTLPDQLRSPLQRYRLTASGRKWMLEHHRPG